MIPGRLVHRRYPAGMSGAVVECISRERLTAGAQAATCHIRRSHNPAGDVGRSAYSWAMQVWETGLTAGIRMQHPETEVHCYDRSSGGTLRR